MGAPTRNEGARRKRSGCSGAEVREAQGKRRAATTAQWQSYATSGDSLQVPLLAPPSLYVTAPPLSPYAESSPYPESSPYLSESSPYLSDSSPEYFAVTAGMPTSYAAPQNEQWMQLEAPQLHLPVCDSSEVTAALLLTRTTTSAACSAPYAHETHLNASAPLYSDGGDCDAMRLCCSSPSAFDAAHFIPIAPSAAALDDCALWSECASSPPLAAVHTPSSSTASDDDMSASWISTPHAYSHALEQHTEQQFERQQHLEQHAHHQHLSPPQHQHAVCMECACRAKKKKRFVWTDRMHALFLTALERLECDQAHVAPLAVMRAMNVPGLTREIVSSHLQKYRLRSHLRSNSGDNSGDSNSSGSSKGVRLELTSAASIC